jgi:hypothetical protein
MVRPKNARNLLSFPLSAPAPEVAAQNWDLRILERRDSLVNALDYLRDEYSAMLARKTTTATDEVLARVETILRNEKVFSYTVVAKLTVHGPTPRNAKRKVLLFSPAVKALQGQLRRD